MTTEELAARLGADEMPRRLEALAWTQQQGVGAAHHLVAVLRHAGASQRARSWAMIGLAQIGPAAAGTARHALIEALSDPSPMMRRGAIATLARLDDLGARDAIVPLLTDDTVDPSAWFDDDCTVAQAARAALAVLARPR